MCDPEVDNPHRKLVRDLLPVGFGQPLTRSRRSPRPHIRARASTGTGAGCLGKPQVPRVARDIQP